MNRFHASLFVLLSSALSGCAYLERQAALEEQRQLAWTGPGSGPCAFGGVTEAAAAHCALINGGTEGALEAINDKVRGVGIPPMLCTDHVAAVRREVARHREFSATPLYSCPAKARAAGECHVSLAVTDRDGARYVLDNGAVVTDTVGVAGVATLADFSSAVEGVVWIGTAPTVEEISAAIPGFKPSATHDFTFR